MSNYTITTDFGAKDSLPSSNSAKVVRGSEFTTEFTNIQTAIATKADTAGDTFTGVVNFSADVAVNTNTLFVDVSAAKVGIGTTSPSEKLQVNGNIKIGDSHIIGDDGFDNLTLISSSPEGIVYGSNTDHIIKTGATGLDATGTERMRITSSGNVGIGTDSPARALHVAGDNDTVRLESTGSNTKIEMVNTGSTTNEFGFLSNNFFVSPDGTEAMRITSSGNVGIGTTSPTEKLHIVGGDLGIGSTQYRENNVVSYASADYSIATSGAYNLTFKTNDTEAMRIDSSGNVLVGTTTTDIAEATTETGIVLNNGGWYEGSRDGGTVGYFNRLSSDGEILSFRKDGSTVGSIGVSGSRPYLSNGVNDGIKIADDYVAPCNQTGADKDASLDLGSSSVRFKDLHLSGTGYFGTSVGIGTTSPSTNLQVENNSNATTTTAVQNTTAGASARANFRAISDNSQLDIYATSSSYTGVASWQDAGVISTAANTSGGLILNSQAHDIKFQTATTERMRIDSSGNLKVGTTSTTPSGGGFAFISGTIGQFRTSHATGTPSGNWYQAFYLGSSVIGTITQAGTTGVNYNTSSDERLKENIADSADAGSKVDAIQIRQFDWIADGTHQDYGVIAQELVTVAPEAVHQPEDSEEMMGVDYSKLVPMLIKEVQSLRSRVAELENA